MDRVYLPLSDMKQAGYALDHLTQRMHTAAFDRLMEIEYQRARSYYARARSLVDVRDRRGLLPTEIMAHVYEEVLEEARRGGYRVLFHRVSLSKWRKVKCALSAWLYCHGF
jgi:phytoene synthase